MHNNIFNLEFNDDPYIIHFLYKITISSDYHSLTPKITLLKIKLIYSSMATSNLCKRTELEREHLCALHMDRESMNKVQDTLDAIYAF